MATSRILIHIGTFKTGTSSFQRHFLDNAAELRAQGVRYLRTGIRRGYAKHLLIFDALIDDGSNTARREGLDFTRMLRSVTDEIRRNPEPVVVISEEEFSHPSDIVPRALAPLAELGAVEVAFVVRRQDTFLESLYLQYLTEPLRELSWTFSEFLADPTIAAKGDFHAIATHWAEVFGPEAIHVADFDILRDGDDFLQTFTARFGLPCPPGDPVDARNASYPADVIEVLRRMVMVEPHLKRRRFCETLVGLGLGEIRRLATDAQRCEILDRYADSNARLHDDFGVDLTGYRTTLTPSTPEQDAAHELRLERATADVAVGFLHATLRASAALPTVDLLREVPLDPSGATGG